MKRRLSVALVFLLAFGVIAVAMAQTTGVHDQETQRFVLPGNAVFLEPFVRVEPDWTKDPQKVRELAFP